MTKEQGSIGSKEALQPQGYPIERFSITGNESLRQWHEEIWPQVQRIFSDTWHSSATAENEDYFGGLLSRKSGQLLLMRDPKTHEIIGTSFLEAMADRRGIDEMFYPWDEHTAYNHSVIIDSRYRQQGLVIPLLERQMEEAALLGYDHMIGVYNANRGEMKDGRSVRKGFATRLKEHPWKNGRIVMSSPLYHYDERGYRNVEEFIDFQLQKPVSVPYMSVRRLSPQPAMVA